MNFCFLGGMLGGGKFKTNADIEKMKKEGDPGRQWSGAKKPSDLVVKVTETLEKLANKYKVDKTAVAIAWGMQKVSETQFCFFLAVLPLWGDIINDIFYQCHSIHMSHLLLVYESYLI